MIKEVKSLIKALLIRKRLFDRNMIKKKKGLINEEIYNYIVYNEGKNMRFLEIDDIEFLIKNINKINETNHYIRMNPFYKNSLLDCQIEFDDYMFYIECRESFTREEQESHWTKCMDKIYDIPHEVEQYKDMDEEKKRMARILYPICKKGDYVSFHNYLNEYEKYLNELIPFLFSKVIKNLTLSQEEMAFGYFCFEVHSG